MNFFQKHAGPMVLSIFFVTMLSVIHFSDNENLEVKSNQNVVAYNDEDVLNQDKIDEENLLSELTWMVNESVLANESEEDINLGLEEDDSLGKLVKAERKVEVEYLNEWKKEIIGDGKNYYVWVYSLKLNNKYFNETLAYLRKWDKIEKVWTENSKWCFKVNVLSSYNNVNKWKKWYVCKKYLSETIVDSFNKAVIVKKVDNKKILADNNTVINWGNYKINVLSLKLNNIYFNKPIAFLDKTDVLKQIWPENSKWCFEVRITITEKSHKLWRQWFVCKKYLKQEELESDWLTF